MRKTIIVVPCHNEAKRLVPQEFLNALNRDENLAFLFVDDGSSDETLVILKDLQTKKPGRIDLLVLANNVGKAEAVRRGMLQTLSCSCDITGYWDSDLATPLEAIAELCQQLYDKDVDLVIGSRVRLLGRTIERNFIRHYLGRVFATFTSLLLDITVYDTQCGAKIFRNHPLLKKVFSKPFKTNWIFDVEVLARFQIVMGVPPREACARWIEYPLNTWVDVKGSKVTVLDYFKAGFEFATLCFFLMTPARRFYEKYIQ